jgi:hypothetical protein
VHYGTRRGLIVMLLSLSVCACGITACERIKGILENISFKKRSPEKKSAKRTDRERILKKFGEPHEKLGIGSTVHTEHGVRYNRKWNYYYSSKTSNAPSMRTIYFVDDTFSGSVIRQPDGTILNEKVKFLY